MVESIQPMPEDSSKIPGFRRKPRQARSQERVDRILAVAKELFVTQGYNVTTTIVIAAQAKVSIGSLYQFFPDKAAILRALSIQDADAMRQQLGAALGTEEATKLPLPEYVDRLVDVANQFSSENPGYQAILMEVWDTIPELDEIDRALDIQLIRDLSAAVSRRTPELTPEDCEAIGFVLVRTVGNMLCIARGQEEKFRQRLIIETKRLALHYWQSYLSIANL
jgi:AcrR family transcriptional regulator